MAAVSQDSPKSSAGGFVLRWGLLALVCVAAVSIRLHAVIHYGRVIHEFDPWFNYRATEYLVDNGLSKFLTWFDDKVWYPLGRPVGTTIYPGMQVTAAVLYRGLQALGFDISLNDVCVFMPAGFGALASLFIYGLAKEASGSYMTGVASAAIMAIIPAHLMRSVAGGYDNESVAVSAICGTFFLWVRALRHDCMCWLWALLAGLMYFYMAATWGAYTFVLEMVAVHATVLILLGRFTRKLHLAYSIFYVVGTIGAMQVPIVGLLPLTSLEQLPALGAFGLVQLMFMLDLAKRHYGTNTAKYEQARMAIFMAVGAVGVAFLAVLMQMGKLGAVTTRVKSLFIPHTKTGNPLVDSVAEHQATGNQVYFQYFHIVVYLAPIGLVFFFSNLKYRGDAKIFVIAYLLISGYFSRKMIRLVLLLAPAASICGGMALTRIFTWSWANLGAASTKAPEEADAAATAATADDDASSSGSAEDSTSKKDKKKNKADKAAAARKATSLADVGSIFSDYLDAQPLLRSSIAVVLLVVFGMGVYSFYGHSFTMSEHLSSPQIMIRGRGRDGNMVMIDDFREAYWWLRDNTPEDSRIMSWWDYGYQINGVANRTTIADGNTWNHEHIALLGKALVSPEKKSHKEITRHLADYVLVWSTRWGGMWGDDLAKMPHMCRIAGSVYSDVSLDQCHMDQNGQPSPAMRKSLLYMLHSYRFDPQVPKPELFREVFTSKNNMVRIWKVLKKSKKSKEHPFGTYPPALEPVLAMKKDFQSPH